MGGFNISLIYGNTSLEILRNIVWNSQYFKAFSSRILFICSTFSLQNMVLFHQIIIHSSNFYLHIVYQPPYLCGIWHCIEANTRLIRRAIKEFNWEKALLNTSINEKVDIFNRTILSILNNFIPHEIILCNYKDPPWFNNRIKTLIQQENASYKIYCHNKDNPDLIYRLQFLQELLSTSIESSKDRYYTRIANRLNNTQKNTKTYWSLLKILFKQYKNPAYTTVISRKYFITDFKEKPELFDSFFFNQCSWLNNNSCYNLPQITDLLLIRDYVQLTSQLII